MPTHLSADTLLSLLTPSKNPVSAPIPEDCWDDPNSPLFFSADDQAVVDRALNLIFRENNAPHYSAPLPALPDDEIELDTSDLIDVEETPASYGRESGVFPTAIKRRTRVLRCG